MACDTVRQTSIWFPRRCSAKQPNTGCSTPVAVKKIEKSIGTNNMAKRKRKPHRARMRQNPKEMAPTSGPKQKAQDPEKGEPNRAGATNTSTDAQRPQSQGPKYEWVTLEHRDAAGNLALPNKGNYIPVYPGPNWITCLTRAGFSAAGWRA